MTQLVLAVPVLNAERFLAHTLQSLNAEGDSVRWWLQDGGSTDGTLDIARQAARTGDVIDSAEDRGQADAINKAFHAMGGDIIGFINGDDRLCPGTALRVLDFFASHPEIDLIYGKVKWINEAGDITGQHAGSIRNLAEVLDVYRVWWGGRQWVQPEVFFRRSLFEKVGDFDIGYHLAFDFDFWVRCFIKRARIAHIPEFFAEFRLHPRQKSAQSKLAAREIRSIVTRYLDAGAPVPPWVRWSLRAQIAYDRYQLGETADAHGNRPSFLKGLLRNPAWLLSPAARSRTQSGLAKVMGIKRFTSHR
ncbi:MAG: hypothetical protein RL088_3327 [Verrucomicrobiota bacterium]